MATSRSGSPQADQEEDKRLLSPLLVSLFSANSLRPGGSRRLGGSRRAIAADITHIRWLLANEIPPGESGRLSYRLIAR